MTWISAHPRFESLHPHVVSPPGLTQPTSSECPASQHRFKGFASNNLKHSNVLSSSRPLRLVVPRRLALKAMEFPPPADPGRRPVVPPTLAAPTPPSRPCSSPVSPPLFFICRFCPIFICVSPFCLIYTKTHSIIHPRLLIMYNFPDCSRCITRMVVSVYLTPVVKWIGI